MIITKKKLSKVFFFFDLFQIYFQEGVYDADHHIDILDSVLVEGGRSCCVLCDALLPPLKMGELYISKY